MTSRRRFLQAAGATLLLPSLRLDAKQNTNIPKRLIYIGKGFGVAGADWFPDQKTTGTTYGLTPSLMPL